MPQIGELDTLLIPRGHRRSDSADLQGSWAFTGKAWRPIITVVVDRHESHETILGSDGQCINLKAPLLLRDASAKSQVEIKVWQESQRKKKSKKRNLVGVASPTLAELLKRQSTEGKVEVRLTCQPVARENSASRGRAQNGSYLVVRVQPPNLCSLSSPASSICGEDVVSSGDNVALKTPTTPSDSFAFDASESQTLECEQMESVGEAKKPRIQGYSIWSSDEEHGDEGDEPHPTYFDLDTRNEDFDVIVDSTKENDGNIPMHSPSGEIRDWIIPSLLPQHTDQVSVASNMSTVEFALDTFTSYRELREACSDTQYERCLSRLQAEWYFVGGSLVALAGLNVTVFGMGPSSTFGIDAFAKRAVAMGSIASGLGLCIDAYFLLRYSGADVEKFQRLATDVFGSYFYFSLSSRLPALCMFLSACALMVFLLAVAWDAWRMAVVVMCLCAGILVSLQFIVYGMHKFVRAVVDACRMIRRAVVLAFARMLPRSLIPQSSPPSS